MSFATVTTSSWKTLPSFSFLATLENKKYVSDFWKELLDDYDKRHFPDNH